MTRRSLPPSRTAHPERTALWIVVAIGLLLMLLASGLANGEDFSGTAKRTDRFNATLTRRSTVRIENISGDIVASPGKEFSAAVATTVSAATQKRAEEILNETSIVQSRGGDEFSLETRWPGSRSWKDGRGRRHASSRCRDCRINARYELTVPAGVAAVLHTVNGDVRVKDLDGELEVKTVNGDVEVRGSRRTLTAQSVNGKVNAAAFALPASASVELKTVNGSVTLVLPKDAKFDLSASTMNGAISSTFPLPSRRDAGDAEETPRKKDRSHVHVRSGRVIVHKGDEDTVVVDLRALEKELEQSMREVEVEIRESMRDAQRELRRFKILDPRREYTASIGQGGSSVRLSALNGPITLLVSGTKESDARPLVSQRESFVVTVPSIEVRVPKPVIRISPAPSLPSWTEDSDEAVERGDISGDFLSTTGGRSYNIGRVSGRVKILTHSGEIHVASAGADADLKTFGGDIRIGSVGGDLSAHTLGGDIRAGSVSGSASAETSGGDIRIEAVKGSIEARTAGGDIVLPSVGGSVEAETGGGEVRVAIVSRQIRGGISIRNSGGDVTLTLPGDFRGDVDLSVLGSSAGIDETMIRSDFSEIALTRRPGSQRATGGLNGGGSRVVVRTSSGTIRLRKGPAAGS